MRFYGLATDNVTHVKTAKLLFCEIGVSVRGRVVLLAPGCATYRSVRYFAARAARTAETETIAPQTDFPAWATPVSRTTRLYRSVPHRTWLACRRYVTSIMMLIETCQCCVILFFKQCDDESDRLNC